MPFLRCGCTWFTVNHNPPNWLVSQSAAGGRHHLSCRSRDIPVRSESASQDDRCRPSGMIIGPPGAMAWVWGEDASSVERFDSRDVKARPRGPREGSNGAAGVVRRHRVRAAEPWPQRVAHAPLARGAPQGSMKGPRAVMRSRCCCRAQRQLEREAMHLRCSAPSVDTARSAVICSGSGGVVLGPADPKSRSAWANEAFPPLGSTLHAAHWALHFTNGRPVRISRIHVSLPTAWATARAPGSRRTRMAPNER